MTLEQDLFPLSPLYSDQFDGSCQASDPGECEVFGTRAVARLSIGLASQRYYAYDVIVESVAVTTMML